MKQEIHNHLGAILMLVILFYYYSFMALNQHARPLDPFRSFWVVIVLQRCHDYLRR